MSDDRDEYPGPEGEWTTLHRRYFASVDKDKLIAAHQAAQLTYNAANAGLRKAEDGVRTAEVTLSEAGKAVEALEAILKGLPDA